MTNTTNKKEKKVEIIQTNNFNSTSTNQSAKEGREKDNMQYAILSIKNGVSNL